MIQTSVQESKTIRFGSAKFEVGPDVANLTNLGAMREVKFEETFDRIKLLSDNAGEINAGIRNQAAAIEGNLMEINLTKLNTLRGGLDNFTTVAGVATPVTDEQITLTSTQQKRLANKNGAGTIVTSIVVKHSSGTPTYVAGTDYVTAIDSDGNTVIARTAASGIADGATVKVSYSYTPNTAVKLTSGGKITISDNVVRLTNTNDAGKIFRITIYKAQTAQGITLEFQPDDGEDPNMVLVRMEGKNDTSRTAGDQLFEIYDEQGV